ncbi:class I SAM-dependent methyltransferase [Geovibrio ferrireducens]|uniref:class I SAM-dependent methyltransferase n=1 Tax=Geovibrio ferrireducens TaxID=46201 RepID=UPI002246A525|nr:class I SAM-dependent methyltransferase [Geovibrio ferrireducens]
MADKSIFNIKKLSLPISSDLRASAAIVPLMEKHFGNKKVRILEIGVFKAGLTKVFAESSLNIEAYDGVDPYLGSKDDPYTGLYWGNALEAESVYKKAKEYYDNQGFSLHRMTSSEYFDNFFGKMEYDIIYVDGDHSFEYALYDFEEFVHMLTEGGVFLIDNYASAGTPGVTKAVNEFIHSYRDVIENIGYYLNEFQNPGKYVPVSQTTVYLTVNKNLLESQKPISSKRYYLSSFLRELAVNQGIRRLAIFGAGRHTEWLARLRTSSVRPDIVAVLDDNPDETKMFFGKKPMKADLFNPSDADAILLSTDVNHTVFRERCIRLYGDALPLLSLYNDFPLPQKKPKHRPVEYSGEKNISPVLPSLTDSCAERIIWAGFYNRSSDKNKFMESVIVHSDSSHYLLLNLALNSPDIDLPNAFVFNAPETVTKCTERSSTVDLPENRNIRYTLETYAVHLKYTLEENHDISYEQALSAVGQMFSYTLNMLESYKPDIAVIWNEFHPLFKVVKLACDFTGTKTVYMEFGCLPGTFQFDIQGQMGESWVALNTEAFNSLHVDEADCIKAVKAVECIKNTEMNRAKQPKKGRLDRMLEGIDQKIVFVAGHNDYSSGIFPYDIAASTFHSPFYRSSAHLFEDMAQRAELNGWFMVFKPHPYAKSHLPESLRTEHYIIVDDVNVEECIDIADVTLTVLSQMSYMALTRGKPVVMTGYNQLRDKGCCYEAFRAEDIDSVINSALIYGFTDLMKENWIKHAARLLKYCLYSDNEALYALPSEIFAKRIQALARHKMTDIEIIKQEI